MTPEGPPDELIRFNIASILPELLACARHQGVLR